MRKHGIKMIEGEFKINTKNMSKGVALDLLLEKRKGSQI